MRQQQDNDRPLFMISVAAELAGMHPQTLRLYERRGLVLPQRTAGKTRRYSQRDVERLQRIQELTELGLNLAGVERVLAMEEQLEALQRQMLLMQQQLAQAAEVMRQEVERVERSHRMELVPVAPQPGRAHRPASPARLRRAGSPRAGSRRRGRASPGRSPSGPPQDRPFHRTPGHPRTRSEGPVWT